ncbi:MAG: hypothetical protein ACON5A_01310 [Candidatus Comchoanobacterales bacterium]
MSHFEQEWFAKVDLYQLVESGGAPLWVKIVNAPFRFVLGVVFNVCNALMLFNIMPPFMLKAIDFLGFILARLVPFSILCIAQIFETFFSVISKAILRFSVLLLAIILSDIVSKLCALVLVLGYAFLVLITQLTISQQIPLYQELYSKFIDNKLDSSDESDSVTFLSMACYALLLLVCGCLFMSDLLVLSATSLIFIDTLPLLFLVPLNSIIFFINESFSFNQLGHQSFVSQGYTKVPSDVFAEGCTPFPQTDKRQSSARNMAEEDKTNNVKTVFASSRG